MSTIVHVTVVEAQHVPDAFIPALLDWEYVISSGLSFKFCVRVIRPFWVAPFFVDILTVFDGAPVTHDLINEKVIVPSVAPSSHKTSVKRSTFQSKVRWWNTIISLVWFLVRKFQLKSLSLDARFSTDPLLDLPMNDAISVLTSTGLKNIGGCCPPDLLLSLTRNPSIFRGLWAGSRKATPPC